MAPDDDDDDRLPPAPSPWRTAAVALGVVLAVAFAATLMLKRTVVATWLRGESDVWGRRRWEEPHPTDRALLGRIDLARVHERLLPRWLVALARAARPDTDAEVASTFRELRAEAGRDPNLAALLDELGRLTREGTGAHAQRILFLAWAWSDYLDRARMPWRISASIRGGGERATLLVTAYRRLADLRVRVGGDAYRARLLRRADRTNVVELYLGETSDDAEGVLVVLDRVHDLAVEDIWPLLDPAGDGGLPPLERAFAPAIRAELAAALPPDVIAALSATAGARRGMEQAREGIRERRECGSRFVVGRLPWSGLDARWTRRIRAMGAAASPEDPCPRVTAEEAEALASGSELVARTPGVHRAVAALVAWLARGVTVHEARHAADARQSGGLEAPLPCPGCPGFLGVGARAELSAFLASFATPGVANVSLFVACHETAEMRGPHTSAMALAASKLGRGTCSGAAPRADLPARAARLERELFGRSERVVLPDRFPPRIWMD